MSKKKLFSLRNLLVILIILLLANIGILVALQPAKSPANKIPSLNDTVIDSSPASNAASSSTQNFPAQATSSLSLPTLPADIAPVDGLRQQGIFILSMADGTYRHIFVYHPQYLPLTRLTNSAADDIDPSVSPDGKKIAFSSRRNGYWDIYILNLETGQIQQFTDTPEYEGSPDWSPDGQWIVFEAYTGADLDILVRSVINPEDDPIRLTDDPGCDHSPVWSPLGREIAFVSNRTGDEEIWLAQLDQVDERYQNISRDSNNRDFYPSWSPDGNQLAWASDQSEGNTILIWNRSKPQENTRPFTAGSRPVWNPSGNAIAAVYREPNGSMLAASLLPNNELYFPLTHLPGSIFGLQWQSGNLIDLLDQYRLPDGASEPVPQLWTAVQSINPPPPGNRFGVVDLKDVAAPFPYLHDQVDESFNRLREEVARQSGWDFLSNLQNAYLPLTEPPTPDNVDNWLYTGRAVAANPMAIYAGWMAVVKEQYHGQTYFRIYLKARYQDGSAGQPMKEQPWEINARYAGNPSSYEQGGRLGVIPSGYWVDFTEIAREFQWNRVPALVNWRSYFDATRLNIYVLDNGLDWQSAMAEIYPKEALITPTFSPTRTPTITITPENFDLVTTTPTPTSTFTPTSRPTWTPGP